MLAGSPEDDDPRSRVSLTPARRRRLRRTGGEIFLILRHADKTVEAVFPDDARNLLLEAGESGSFVISEAVLASLRERGLSYGDVRNALARLVSAAPTPLDGAGAAESGNGWCIVGPTMDGEQMTVTVAIESGIVMVI